MTLEDHTDTMLSWANGQPITIMIVCHCGEQFPIARLDDAQAHVKNHGSDDAAALVD